MKPLKARSHWWNSDETVMKHVESAWNRMNQSDETVMKHVESEWMSNETFCFMIVKHRETCWIRMKHDYETPWIRMKQCVSWSWNTMFHANETPLIRDGDHRDIDFFILRCFMLFHAVSCRFIAVSLLFHAVSLLFHDVSSLCFMVFHCPVSSCFMTMKQMRWERAFSCITLNHRGCIYNIR